MTTNNRLGARPGHRAIVSALATCALTFVCGVNAANATIDPDQSRVSSPAGDGWQVLGAAGSAPSGAATPNDAPGTPGTSAGTALSASTDVKTVVLPGVASAPVASANLSFSIAPQDMNLRNALDRWLQTQGWQLAWKIDDDLPVEFNASFSGDFDGVLTQVMQATNHMRTPARVCEHTNNVVRVIARAANCQD